MADSSLGMLEYDANQMCFVQDVPSWSLSPSGAATLQPL